MTRTDPRLHADDDPVIGQIEQYLASQPDPKGRDLRELHQIAVEAAPESRLWFLDGTDETGRTVTNPNVGYGVRTITYANGTSREFYRVGMSANTAGISVYIMGIEDKRWLMTAYGDRIGKAKVTSYCISFKRLADIEVAVLAEAIQTALRT